MSFGKWKPTSSCSFNRYAHKQELIGLLQLLIHQVDRLIANNAATT
jgi:hypothetical protein